MGKYVLLVVMAALGIWGLSMAQYQSNQNAAEAEADHQNQVLARQVARTGFNVIQARINETDEQCPTDLLNGISSPLQGEHESGDFDHGQYRAWIQPVPSTDLGYQVISKGTFQGKTVRINEFIQPDFASGELLYAKDNQELHQYPEEGDGGLETHPEVKAMGPFEVNLDGDELKEIPYVPEEDSGKIKMTDMEGNKNTLVNADQDDEAVPADDTTQLAAGSWGDENNPAVFYANSNRDAIYRISWDGDGGQNDNDPEMVAELTNSRNGADAVVGIADVNGDQEDDLVFVDGSQELRYMEDEDADEDEAFPKIDNGSVGQSEGLGVGSLVDLNGDGTSSVVFVNGSNEIRIVNDVENDAENDAEKVDRTIEVDDSGPGAAKAPPTVADMDGDGDLDVAYMVKGEDQENVQ